MFNDFEHAYLEIREFMDDVFPVVSLCGYRVVQEGKHLQSLKLSKYLVVCMFMDKSGQWRGSNFWQISDPGF